MKKSAQMAEAEREERINLARQGLHMAADALVQSLGMTEDEVSVALGDLADWFHGSQLTKGKGIGLKVLKPLILMADGKDGA